jgi:ABC-type multidrug transport system fused ATPase/permease subunit
MEEIITAAKIADIHSFIETLPQKYDTVLDEFAANLSEGQKQRISIARALVRYPDILIFDEPTASLDNVTEHHIYSLLPDFVKSKTTFTIAHRLNTVKNADKVMFFRDGMETLIGTHKELMENIDYKNFFEES